MHIPTPHLTCPYQSLRDQEVEPQKLLETLGSFRSLEDPSLQDLLSYGNICMELATMPRYRQSAESLFAEADMTFSRIEQAQTRKKDYGFRRVQLHAAIQRVFLPLFEKTVAGATIDMEDQHVVLAGLHATVTPARTADIEAVNPSPNGGLWSEWYEIMIHALCARHNLLQGEISLYTWPAFTRFGVQGQPKPSEIRRDWNIAVSTEAFLAQDFQKIKPLGSLLQNRLRHGTIPQFQADIRPLPLSENLQRGTVRQASHFIYQEHELWLQEENDGLQPQDSLKLKRYEKIVDGYARGLLAILTPGN